MKNPKPSWDFTGSVFLSYFWRLCVNVGVCGLGLGIPLGMLGAISGWEASKTALVGRIIGYVIAIPCMLIALRGALAVHVCFKDEPSQPTDRPPPPIG